MQKLTKKQLQAAETKLKITETALNLFKTHGYDAVRIQDICQTANISVGAFYHHFKCKENIITTAYKEVEFLVSSSVEENSYSSPIEKLYALYDKAAEMAESLGWSFISQIYRQLLASNYNYSLSDERYTYIEIHKMMQEAIKISLIPKHHCAKTLTLTLIRFQRGLIFDWCLHQGSYNLRKKTKGDLDMLLFLIQESDKSFDSLRDSYFKFHY